MLRLVCVAHYFSFVVMTPCELCKAPKSPEDHRVSRKKVEAGTSHKLPNRAPARAGLGEKTIALIENLADTDQP